MGASNGRIQQQQQQQNDSLERKTNSSLSHNDSDFSVSVDGRDNYLFKDNDFHQDSESKRPPPIGGRPLLSREASQVLLRSSSSYSQRYNPTNNMILSEHPELLPCRCGSRSSSDDPTEGVSGASGGSISSTSLHPMNRMSLRVYNNGPPIPHPPPCTTSTVVATGRVSPNHDLGYHTLLSRETTSGSPSLTKKLSDVVVSSSGSNCWDVLSVARQGSPLMQQQPLHRHYHRKQCPSPATIVTTPTSTYSSGSDTGLLLTGYKGKRLPKASPFDRLGDDVVLKILSYLSTNQLCACSRVCRRWYFLAWEPQLWTTIELMGERTVADRALRTVLQLLCRDSPSVCLTVERVILNGCARLTDRGLLTVARHCPELRRLELKGCHLVTNDGIFELVTCCVNLEHLDVTGCTQINCIDIDQGKVPMLFDDCSSPQPRHSYIQYLDMTDCHGLADAGLKVIVRNCPQLCHLYLRRCVGVTDVGVKYVAGYCVVLREFSVSDCNQVTDFGMYELAKLGPNLRYLSVAKCDQISDAGIKQIARHCYKLRYLNVRGCEAVSDDSVVMLARSCPRLRAVDVGKCDVTDHGLKLLSENCPNLRKLSVKSCDMVTDKGIQFIAYYCRGLQQLNIQDCQITVDGYRTVKKYCKRCIIEHTNPGFC